MQDLINEDFEFGFVDNTPQAGPPLSPYYYDHQVAAETLKPFRKLRGVARQELIDPTILAMMQSSQAAMLVAGDVFDAFVAEVDLGIGDIVVAHEDPKVQEIYRHWFFDVLDAPYWIYDALLTTSIYGNAFTAVLGVGEDMSITNLNPMRVAVGRSTSFTRSPVWFGEQGLLFHKAQPAQFNEWQDIVDGGGLPIDPETIFHMHTPKPHHQRYGLPRVIFAWDDITSRRTLDEMVRGTVEGIQNQIRVWTIKSPMQGEIRRLREELRANRLSRTHDLAWDDRLSVSIVSPAVVDQLLAIDTWVRLTSSIFRKLGMSLRLVSQTVGMEINGRSDTMQAEILVHISRLRARVQRPGLSLAQQIARWIATFGDPSLAAYPPPVITVKDTYVAISEMVRNVYVPLLNFGLVSSRTVHEAIGIDNDVEIERLKKEIGLRRTGVISPYVGFAQTGPSGVTQSPQSQGRPPGADTNPDNAATNRQNAAGP